MKPSDDRQSSKPGARDLDFLHVFMPAATPAPDAVTLLLLHGTGGDERELLPLGRELWPGAALLGVRGHVLENGAPRFFCRLAEGGFDVYDLKERTNELARFVDSAAKKYGFSKRHLIAVGASIVWQAFGEKNGARTEEEMRVRIARYRRAPNPVTAADYQIGCILLESPFFFNRADWVPLPDWKREIVRGRGYDSEGDGREIWQRVESLLRATHPQEQLFEETRRYGEAVAVFPRLGQGSFRLIVTDSYQRRCAFTNSPVLHVLEAAHIRPYSSGGTHAPSNGILLRQDLHTLFDRGYMTVTPSHRIEVSSRIKEEFHNGKEYYALHGQNMRLPEYGNRQPSAEFLTWHNENVYRT